MYGIALVASGAILAGGLVTIPARSRKRDTMTGARQHAALAPAPSSVTIDVLGADLPVGMGRSLPVRIQAIGDDITEVALWEDDRVVASSEVGPDTDALARRIDWTAVRPGPHILHASVTSASGTAHSPVVPVEVAITRGTPEDIVVVVAPGTTPEDFAARHGIEPALVRTTTVSASGQPGDVPDPTVLSIDAVGVAEQVAAEMKDPSSTSAGSGSQTAGGGGGPSASDEPTGPPVLAVKRGDCSVTISATGATGDLVVYRATSGTVGFEEVGTLTRGGKLELDRLSPGAMVFVAGPEGSPTTTEPVSVLLPDDCVKSLWDGDVSLVDGVLRIPKPDTGRLWFYLSVDDAPAVRVPESQLQTFKAPTNRINVRNLLPVLDGSKIHLEVWSYHPGDDEAVKVGTGDAVLPEGTTPTDLLGESSASTLRLDRTQVKVADKSVHASWTAVSDRVDRVVWQVTTQPLATSDTSLAPLGLVAEGVSLATGVGKNGSGRSGVFDIPVKNLTYDVPTPITIDPLDHSQIVKGSKVLEEPKQVGPVIPDEMAINPATIEASLTSTAEVGGGIVPPPVISGSTYYVRIIPMEGAALLGGVSESVRFDMPVPTDPPQVALKGMHTDFTGGRAANPALSSCIRVTHIPWAGHDNSPWKVPDENTFYSSFFPNVGTYCPGDWASADESCWAPEILCDAWDAVVEGLSVVYEFATKLWDLIAWTYNSLIDLVVTVTAWLNPYCLTAVGAAVASDALGFDKAITDTAKGAADLCHKVYEVGTRAVVGAVLVSLGLPPSLPTSQQLVAMAKGDLTELAVSYLEQLGVPCDDLVIDAGTAGLVSAGIEQAGGDVPDGVADGVDVCRDAIGVIASEIQDQVEAMVQKQIAASTGLPLPWWPIEGFDFSFEPRGTYQPPSIKITALPQDPSAPMNGVCPVEVGANLERPQDTQFSKPVFAPVKFDLRRPFYSDKWSGETSFVFNDGVLDLGEQQLAFATSVRGYVKSDCIAGAENYSLFSYVHEPKGRWQPGDPD